MPDISMCMNETCPIKKSCYRYTATPSEHWQSYGSFVWKDGKCDHYWPVEEGYNERDK